ncbi:MAG: TetR/AcrR family transcriptional regulator [Kiritimatiellales bacterium]|nr:TetR/AcrR family transcriptional regulator [Kiritimatiellales bacterium]
MAENTDKSTQNAQGRLTCKRILNSAGKLFATQGFDGVGIRDISEDSGVGLSTIIYHFKSKENIYLETIRHFVVEDAGLDSHFKPLFTVDTSNPQAVSDALRNCIRSFLDACHGKHHVKHLAGLYCRILSDSHPQALILLMECFANIKLALPEWVARIRPEMTREQIAFWVQLFWAQLQYTVAGKQLILHDMELGEGYSEEYLDISAWFFAYHCALPLGLPEPTRFDSMDSPSNP